MKFDQEPPSDARLAQGLAALKRNGGSVLVVGAASVAQNDVCRRFLGGDDPHVLVDTDGPVRDGNDDEAAEVIRRPVQTRSTAAATGSPSVPDFGSIAAELEAKMWATTGGGDTVRVCFDSLRPFVETTATPTLASALESIRETAADVGAVVHFHLPAMTEAIPTALFESVDAVVEVRRSGGTTYQRWRLADESEPSDWVEV